MTRRVTPSSDVSGCATTIANLGSSLAAGLVNRLPGVSARATTPESGSVSQVGAGEVSAGALNRAGRVCCKAVASSFASGVVPSHISDDESEDGFRLISKTGVPRVRAMKLSLRPRSWEGLYPRPNEVSSGRGRRPLAAK